MTRIQAARRRVTVARYAIAITSAAALAAFAAVARVSHPGSAHASRTGSAAGTASTAQQEDSFFNGSFSDIGPSGSASPQVQSGAS